MVDLNSIDLTQNKRFERIVNNEEYEKRFARDNDDRGVHRLKKGEIPHKSSNNSVITVTEGEHLITTISNNWIVSTDDTVNNLWLTTNTATTPVNSVTSDLISWTITEDSDNGNMSFNFGGDIYSYGTSTSVLNHGYRLTSKTSKTKDVQERLLMDPFHDPVIIDSYSSIKRRLSKEEEDPLYLSYHKRESIKNRLDYKSDYNRHVSDVGLMYSYLHVPPIIDRMFEEDIDDRLDSEWFRINRQHDDDYELRKKAPFIRRVYTTNRGMSFDSAEFKHEMTLAKERFDLAVQSQM